METIEGKILLESGHAVWYRRVGTGERLPLLVLHGGPGAGHDYLEPLEKMEASPAVLPHEPAGSRRYQTSRLCGSRKCCPSACTRDHRPVHQEELPQFFAAHRSVAGLNRRCCRTPG